MIAGRDHYYTAHGQLPGIREIDSSANAAAVAAERRGRPRARGRTHDGDDASSIAHVATAKPGPYMKQLCRHFGHRNEVTFDDERGEIRAVERRRARSTRAPPAQLRADRHRGRRRRASSA